MILFGSSSIFCNLSLNLLKKIEKQNYIGLGKREKKREKQNRKKKSLGVQIAYSFWLFFGHRKLIIIMEILKKHFQRLLIFGFYTLWVWLYFPIAVFKEKSIIAIILYSLIYLKMQCNPFFLNENGSVWTHNLSYLLP